MNLFRQIFLFLLFLVLSKSAVFGQLHYKFPIVNYTPKNYGKSQGVQNWALTQSKEGILFSGSNNGLVSYDGNRWGFIPVVNGKWVYSLATDSSNVMFAGTEGNFGFFEKDKKGKLNYVSLSDSLLKEEDKFFGRIWRIFAGTERVYFQCNEAVFVYDYKSLKTLYPKSGTSFHLASFANNTLYVRERQKGLMKCANDQLVFIPNSQLFAEYGVFAMLPFSSDPSKILVVTKEQGLHIYNSKTDEFTPFITLQNSVWYNAGIIGGIKLRNGLFALNSELFGTIILNENGDIIHYINDAIGLQDNNVVAQFEDNTGNLWLALNKGLSNVDINSPLQSFTSVSGSIYSVISFNEKIYLASSNGLYVKDKSDADFLPDFNFPLNCIIWQLYDAGEKFYLATSEGVFSYDGKIAKQLIRGNFRRIKITKNGKILVGGADGLILLKKNSETEHQFSEEISGEILGIEEDPKSNETNGIYWVSTNNALYRIIDSQNAAYKVKPYDESYGLTNDWKFPFVFENKIVAGNNFGLYELSSQQSDSAIWETIRFYGEESAQKSFSFLKDYQDKTVAIIENKPHIYIKGSGKEIYKPFLPIDLGKENALYSYNNKLFICLDEGLVIYNEKDQKKYEIPFQTVIRRVSTKKDSVIYDGAFTGIHELNELNFEFNELSLEFTCNYYNNEEKNLFRYKLEGADTSFSSWQQEHKIKFNNLHEGSYKLIVQSKNVFDYEGEDAVINFTVLPPWYRTSLAYIAYVIIFLLFIYSAVKIASYRLKEQNRQLDKLVKERTREIADKNEELKEQNIQILHQKQEITDSINYAKRIQNAILPPLEEIKNAHDGIFVFFQPKDIVSGDFYWFQKINENEFLIASADCTGHGVPGGFMSMVCSDKLNEAVTRTTEPGEILKHVNIRIKQSLRQDNREGSTKDGMEIALVRVNTLTKTIVYAGANRFLWIIRKSSGQLEEIKPTKAGIGGFTDDSQQFISHEINYVSGDHFYMSTDGFGDQFGGSEGKKLMTKNFKQFLLGITELPAEKQKEQAEKYINNWKGNYEQVDDILVIGLVF